MTLTHYEQGLRAEGDSSEGGGKHERGGGGYCFEKEICLGWIGRSPDRVCFGEEGEGHFMSRGRRWKRLGNRKRKVWYEEPGG